MSLLFVLLFADGRRRETPRILRKHQMPAHLPGTSESDSKTKTQRYRRTGCQRQHARKRHGMVSSTFPDEVLRKGEGESERARADGGHQDPSHAEVRHRGQRRSAYTIPGSPLSATKFLLPPLLLTAPAPLPFFRKACGSSALQQFPIPDLRPSSKKSIFALATPFLVCRSGTAPPPWKDPSLSRFRRRLNCAQGDGIWRDPGLLSPERRQIHHRSCESRSELPPEETAVCPLHSTSGEGRCAARLFRRARGIWNSLFTPVNKSLHILPLLRLCHFRWRKPWSCHLSCLGF